MRRTMVMAMVVLASSACSNVTFEEGSPVSLELTADLATVSSGGEVTFSYTAVGSALVRLTVDFGDGSSTTVNTVGAQTASGRITHTFQASGSFTVVGTLEDGVQGLATDDVLVVVTAAQSVAAGAGVSPP